MSLDRTPPYLQVVRSLKSRIADGDLKEGDQLPSVRQIAAERGISEATALKVVATLRAAGLVESRVGVGTFVCTRNMSHTARDRYTHTLRTGRVYPPGEGARIMSSALAPAPGPVADVLGIDEGAPAVRRHRVKSGPTGPVSTSTAWFPAELAGRVPGLLSTAPIEGGTPAAIREATGRLAVSAESRTAAEVATVEQAEELGLREGDPVFLEFTVLRDADGEVVQVDAGVCGPGRWKFTEYRLDG